METFEIVLDIIQDDTATIELSPNYGAEIDIQPDDIVQLWLT